MLRQDHQDIIDAGALSLMDGQREDQIVRRQLGREKRLVFPAAVLAGASGFAEINPAVIPADADFAILQAGEFVVLQDYYRRASAIQGQTQAFGNQPI